MMVNRCCAVGGVVVVVLLASLRASAQDAPATLPDLPGDAPTEPAAEPHRPSTIGGMPEAARPSTENPVLTLGIDLGVGSYTLSVLTSLIYLVAVYPAQALFGSSRVEPVTLWLLLPIAGPWMAQYEDHVRDKPVWRGLLIADAGMQAAGLVLGLIGVVIDGRHPGTRASRRTGLAVGPTGVTLTQSW